MKGLLIVFVMMIGFFGLNAQSNSNDVEKNVVLEKIDKNSELAFVYQNGVLLEKGVLKNGKREGVWQSFNEKGNIVTEASFSKGVKNGVWIVYDQAEVKYVLYYQNDQRIQANDLASAK